VPLQGEIIFCFNESSGFTHAYPGGLPGCEVVSMNTKTQYQPNALPMKNSLD